LALLSTAGKYKNINITRDDEALNLHSGHFVCIGSPKANLKTKQIFETIADLPVDFGWIDTSRYALLSRISKNSWEPQDGLDFGLILKVPTGQSPLNYALVLAGVSHVGTAATGWYLWRHWQALAQDFEDSPFALVVRVTVPHHQLCVPVFKAVWSNKQGWQCIANDTSLP
jgi:hypothetical protein